MGENTNIEWATHTFNPWIGCTKVSPACDHCYAETWDKRFGGERWGARAPRQRTSRANWLKPLKWDVEAMAAGRRDRVFCASLADVFDNHGSITSGWHGDLWHLISQTPNLDWLLLTKRPQNIVKMLPETYGAPAWGDGWPNVWLGTTCENQEEADRRIPHLLSVTAKVHFLSCEPLLGPIDLSRWLWGRDVPCPGCPEDADCSCGHLPRHMLEGEADIAWVIVGGESGPGARPMHPGWARALRDDCKAAGVAFHFKQWGEWRLDECSFSVTKRDTVVFDGEVMNRIGKKAAGRLLDGVEHNGVPT